MTEERTIPEAMDPKNVGIDDESLLSEVFYFIDGKNNATLSTTLVLEIINIFIYFST